MALDIIKLKRVIAESSELRSKPRSYAEHLAWKAVLAEAARAGLGSEFSAAQYLEESKLGDDVPHAPVGAISRKGVC